MTQDVDSYTQLAGGTLETEIGSTTSFDQVNVCGLADLDGTLRIELENGFVPDVGTTFDFLTFGSHSGAFSPGEHLYGFAQGARYFEVVSQSDRLTLSDREARLARVLDQSTVLLSGLTWLERLFVHRLYYSNHSRVLSRLRQITSRLDHLATSALTRTE